MSSGNHLYLDPLLVQVCLYEFWEPFISGPLTRSGLSVWVLRTIYIWTPYSFRSVSMSPGNHLYLDPLLVQVCLYEFWEPFISGPLTRSGVSLWVLGTIYIWAPYSFRSVSMSSGNHLYLDPLLVQVCLYESWEPFISGPLTRSGMSVWVLGTIYIWARYSFRSVCMSSGIHLYLDPLLVQLSVWVASGPVALSVRRSGLPGDGVDVKWRWRRVVSHA